MSAVYEKRSFTAEEFVKLSEIGILRSDEHVELIGGEIVRMPPERFAMSPQGPVHSGVTSVVHETLSRLFPGTRFCIRLHSPFQASEADLPEPDIAVLPGPCRDYVQEFPRKAELLIEVAFTSQAYDRGIKANIYARAGVPEYWVIDVPGRRMEAFREPSSKGYRAVRFYSEGDTILPLGFEGMEHEGIPVAEFFPLAEDGA